MFIVTVAHEPSLTDEASWPDRHGSVRIGTGCCGYGTLLVDINGMAWSTAEIPVNDVGMPVEPTWPTDENIVFELELVNDRTLLVRAIDSDISHVYRPDPSPPGCL